MYYFFHDRHHVDGIFSNVGNFFISRQIKKNERALSSETVLV